MPEPLGLAGDELPGHAMACSLQGTPYRGSAARKRRASSDPTNQLPTSLQWGRPHGHREAPLLIYNLLRVAQAVLQCKCNDRDKFSVCNRKKNIYPGSPESSAPSLWKAVLSAGNGKARYKGTREHKKAGR
jgi:hypothetical protein